MKTTAYFAPIEVLDAIGDARRPEAAAKSVLLRLVARWTASADDTASLKDDLAALDDHLLRDIGVLDATHGRRGN